MKSFIYKCFIGGSVALSMTLSSCLGDLDLKPIDDNVIQLSDFKDNPQYYTQLLAKVYAGLAVSGQEGPAGNPDIQGFDEGQAQYLRAYWNYRRSRVRLERCWTTRTEYVHMVGSQRFCICHV